MNLIKCIKTVWIWGRLFKNKDLCLILSIQESKIYEGMSAKGLILRIMIKEKRSRWLGGKR